MADSLYNDHKKLTTYLDRNCMDVDELAKKTRLDKQLILDHLQIKELDRNGLWTSENGEFCSYDVVVKLLSRLEGS